MKPLYIFDLDGTLALIDHRRHLADANRWDEFYRACVYDLPNFNIYHLFNELRRNGEVRIWSGRSSLVRIETIGWFMKHYRMHISDVHYMLKMRNNGDTTPDQQLKAKWHEELPQEDKDRLLCVFDDRQKVVDMWRSKGITCLQVAPGNF